MMEAVYAGRIIAAMALAPGCTFETTEVPLSKLNATFYVQPWSGAQSISLGTPLEPESEPCPVLPGGTTATVDGIRGEVDVGGSETPHGERHCIGPSVTWVAPPRTTGPSTFVIDDGDTSWTFIVHAPFATRGFKLVAPANGTLSSGDAATVRLDPPGETLTNARVFASSGFTEYFMANEANGLVVSGTDMQFTVPTVRAATTTLSMAADIELLVERCDAPLGCVTKGVFSSMQPVTLVP
ncbi:hypothetical protein BH11MYX3_BH11MYX3_39260 [soil metagenome]